MEEDIILQRGFERLQGVFGDFSKGVVLEIGDGALSIDVRLSGILGTPATVVDTDTAETTEPERLPPRRNVSPTAVLDTNASFGLTPPTLNPVLFPPLANSKASNPGAPNRL
jgi:hypothetical protein